jgi:thiol-disulfide isomerase/thioredoxin
VRNIKKREVPIMISEKSLNVVRKSSAQLKKPVRLVLFTSDAGCANCPEMKELSHAIKSHMGKVALENYDVVMDRDKTQLYGIQQVPAIVLQGGEGQTVVFYGLVEDVFLEVFMETLRSLSETRVWFPEDVRRALKHLVHDVQIRVFVESDCPLCRPVAETAVGLALESGFVNTAIIAADDFPELIKKYKIKKLPMTIFGDNLQMEGHVTESEFLEMIFEAEGVKPGPDRRCLSCGKPSADVICENCKTRIQAEAIDHKTRTEKGLQQP